MLAIRSRTPSIVVQFSFFTRRIWRRLVADVGALLPSPVFSPGRGGGAVRLT